MTQESYPPSDLDSLLSKDNITEDDLLQLPELLLEERRNAPNKTPVNHQAENLSLTPTDKPTIALSDRPKQRKLIIPSRQLIQRQKKNEEATSNYSFTENAQFQFFLSYRIKENINQWRMVVWEPKRQKFTLRNPSLNFQRLSGPLRSISAFY